MHGPLQSMSTTQHTLFLSPLDRTLALPPPLPPCGNATAHAGPLLLRVLPALLGGGPRGGGRLLAVLLLERLNLEGAGKVRARRFCLHLRVSSGVLSASNGALRSTWNARLRLTMHQGHLKAPLQTTIEFGIQCQTSKTNHAPWTTRRTPGNAAQARP